MSLFHVKHERLRYPTTGCVEEFPCRQWTLSRQWSAGGLRLAPGGEPNYAAKGCGFVVGSVGVASCAAVGAVGTPMPGAGYVVGPPLIKQGTNMLAMLPVPRGHVEGK